MPPSPFPCAGGSRASSAGRPASRPGSTGRGGGVRSGSTTPRSWNGGPAAARGRAAAKRADEALQALMAEAEGAAKEARATCERVLEQRQQDQEHRAREALSITRAAEDDIERLVQEREDLELKLAEHLQQVRDLEVSSICMGDYMTEAQKRAKDMERVLRMGHPSGTRHGWAPVEIEEQDDSFDAVGETGLDAGGEAGRRSTSPRSAAGSRPPGSASGRPRRSPAPSVGGATARRAVAFQDIQEDLRAVKDHPRQIAQDTSELEERLQESYAEKRRLETAVADRRHAAAITETLVHLRREAHSRAPPATFAAQSVAA